MICFLFVVPCYAFLPVLFPLLHFDFIFRSLQRTLNELKEYQKQHDHYLRQQEALDKHKLLQEEQILRNIIHETQMAKEAQLGKVPHTWNWEHLMCARHHFWDIEEVLTAEKLFTFAVQKKRVDLLWLKNADVRNYDKYIWWTDGFSAVKLHLSFWRKVTLYYWLQRTELSIE